jgi:hypothetical protein
VAGRRAAAAPLTPVLPVQPWAAASVVQAEPARGELLPVVLAAVVAELAALVVLGRAAAAARSSSWPPPIVQAPPR